MQQPLTEEEGVLKRWGAVLQKLNTVVGESGARVSSRDERKKRYAVLITLSEQLIADFQNKYYEGDASFKESFLEMSLLRRMVLGSGISYDCSPVMDNVNGFVAMYAQVVFGLFLNRILGCISHPNVEFHVLCQGWGYKIKDSWWNESDPHKYNVSSIHKRIVMLCLRSKDFYSIKNPNNLDEGKHLRTIVWMGMYGHAFAVGWDFHKTSGTVSGQFFYIDCNHHNDFALNVLSEFRDRLHEKFKIGGISILQPKSIVLRQEVGATSEFACVPFMVRSTMYMSMVEQIYSSSDAGPLTDMTAAASGLSEMDFSLKIYDRYEEMLLEIVEYLTPQRKLIILPRYFISSSFVSINRVYLEALNVDQKTIVNYCFQGFENGFVEFKPEGNPQDGRCVGGGVVSDCAMSSRFPSPDTTNPLATIRECLLLINTLRL